MNYYAFIPNEDGKAPLGSGGRAILKDYKTDRGAVRTAVRRLGTKEIAVFSFTNFYDDNSFKLVWNGTKLKSETIKP